MKNEVMAKAMTGIDDELIAAAHAEQKRSYKRKPFYLIGAAAASIVLLFGSTRYLEHRHSFEILVQGKPIEERMIVQGTPALASDIMRQSVSNQITIPVEIHTSGRMQIRALDGSLEIFSLKKNQLLCVGQFFNVTEPVRINWIIEKPEEDQSYQLQLGSEAGVLRVTYDKKIQNWTIIKVE